MTQNPTLTNTLECGCSVELLENGQALISGCKTHTARFGYYCQIGDCNKVFRRRQDLKTHKNEAHGY